jgi:platelet-activating factor acetylhydrolase
MLFHAVFGMPLLSNQLPDYSGQYPVGTIDLEVPVPKRNISDAVFKESGEPAFELDTVLFSLFYPAVNVFRTSKAHHSWCPDIAQHGKGYAMFAGIDNFVTNHVFSFALWSLVGSTTVPANVDVPIRGNVNQYLQYEPQEPIDTYGLSEFPVIVFSHGAASTRTSYTQWCGELASRGFVVAAIEHRDGSGPGSMVMQRDGSSRAVYPISASQLSPQPETADFKVMQLAMREAEVEETVNVLRQINAGFGKQLFQSNPREEGMDLLEWKGRLNMDRVVIAGHSYGATLALQTLKDAPSERLPFVGGIILDPGKQSGPLNNEIGVPILVVHSQSWSSKRSIFFGRPHFDVVKELVKKVLRGDKNRKPQYAWFLTSRHTSHASVTDAPLIEPFLLSWATGSTIDARQGVLEYVKVGDEFMRYLEDGHRTGVLAEDVTHVNYNEEVKHGGKKLRKLSKEIQNYWMIHVAPSTECAYPGLYGVDKEEYDR